MDFEVTKEYDEMYPEYLPVKISVKTKAGEQQKEVTVPKGHFKNPYDWKDLENKGHRLIKDPEKVKRLIDLGKNFERSSTRELLEAVNFE